LEKLGLANKNQEMHKQAILKQAEESKKNDVGGPKLTVVNKREPVEDDITAELLKETENAKVALSQQDKAKKDAAK